MANYEEEMPFAGMVNKHEEMVRKKEMDADRLNEYFASTERAIQESIGRAESKAEVQRKFDERVVQLEKQRKLKIAALVLAGTVFLGGLVYGGKRVSEQQDIKAATSMGTQDAVDELSNLLVYRNGGSITYSTDIGVRSLFQSLTTDDYSKLTVNNIGQIYSYKLVLRDAEFEEFIKSLTYLENGEERHYVSFKQFLNINGFGSEKEFINKAEAQLLDYYGNQSHKARGGI